MLAPDIRARHFPDAAAHVRSACAEVYMSRDSPAGRGALRLLVWLEEPIIPDDVDGLARVAVEGGAPIATGENLHSVYEFEQTIARGRVSCPEPDAATLGGVSPWLRVARLAEARNLPVTSHGIHDIHVHLLGAVPDGSWLEFHGFGLERFLAEPLGLEDGCAVAPDRPGHGVELDFDALAEHRV